MNQEDAHLRERGVTQERVFSGKLLRIRVDTVILPNGEMANREIIEHPGAAAVVPLTADGRVHLVRQYRYPIDAITLELPCGKLEHLGESVEAAALRELTEETGCHQPRQFVYLGATHSTPGCSNEVIHLFAAKDFTEGDACADPDEFLELVTVPLSEAIAMIRRGAITDSKTIIGLLWVSQFGLASEQLPPARGTFHDEEAS